MLLYLKTENLHALLKCHENNCQPVLSEQAKSDQILRREKLRKKKLMIYRNKNIYNLPLYIDETPAITIATLSNRAGD